MLIGYSSIHIDVIFLIQYGISLRIYYRNNPVALYMENQIIFCRHLLLLIECLKINANWIKTIEDNLMLSNVVKFKGSYNRFDLFSICRHPFHLILHHQLQELVPGIPSHHFHPYNHFLHHIETRRRCILRQYTQTHYLFWYILSGKIDKWNCKI